MTTQAQGSGRSSAIHRLIRGQARFLIAGLFAVGSLPVFAQQHVQATVAHDPIEFGLLAPIGDTTLRGPLSLPGRSMTFAKDVRSIFETAQVTSSSDETLPDPPSEGRIKTMLKRALALLGTPYRWGGTSPEHGFDCSGLVGYVFRNSLGIELPRISRDMANVGQLIRDPNALVEGDLVFFSRRGKHVDHVGIYIGNGQFVHAPRTGKDVEVANLAVGYWSKKFFQARRVAAQ
ncbi:MAG: C40 family peptidase [Lysobacteraceae bacterium]